MWSSVGMNLKPNFTSINGFNFFNQKMNHMCTKHD